MDIKQTEKYIETISLENNLDLVMTFICKHIAGDRCQVTIEAAIEVEVKDEYFNKKELSDLSTDYVKSLLGNTTSFTYSKVRNFIAEDKKENLFEELKQQFMDSSLNYISSDLFPVRLIKRNFMIAQKEDMIRQKREALQ